jgi:hypothetical protein
VAKNLIYSNRDLTGQIFLDQPVGDFAGDIQGSCFYQQVYDTEVFPAGTVCNFIGCNLDNVLVPAGCTMEGCTNKRLMGLPDGEMYIVDAAGAPIQLLNQEQFDADKAAKMLAFEQEGMAVVEAHYPSFRREVLLNLLVQAIATGKMHQAMYIGQYQQWGGYVTMKSMEAQAAVMACTLPAQLEQIVMDHSVEALDPLVTIAQAMQITN